jgi:hypothetical protein
VRNSEILVIFPWVPEMVVVAVVVVVAMRYWHLHRRYFPDGLSYWGYDCDWGYFEGRGGWG